MFDHDLFYVQFVLSSIQKFDSVQNFGKPVLLPAIRMGTDGISVYFNSLKAIPVFIMNHGARPQGFMWNEPLRDVAVKERERQFVSL